MSESQITLPRWDMSVVYPGLESVEFETGFQEAIQSIDRLVELFDQHGVGLQEAMELDDATVQSFEVVLQEFNRLLAETRTMGAYIASFVTTDTRNDLAQAKHSEFQQHTVKLTLLSSRFKAWVGSLDIETLIERSEQAQAHAFALRRAKVEATHLMSPPEEELAAKMNLSGGSGWGKLHSDISSQLTVSVEI
ncbi:MAG TPA: oligoendopeptidase F, partial [Anaerolineae bacterium]|nr:oligoendopeptidase F [Anaerolineae bacterium]